MNKRYIVFGGLVLVILLALVFNKRQASRIVSAQLVKPTASSSGSLPVSGFSRVTGPHAFKNPQDFGPHPDNQTEWWYYTGNLDSPQGQHFGYQLTFFRRGLVPLKDLPARQSDWSASQVYMAHFAITDVEKNNHQSFERLSRGAAGLAGSLADPFHVWLEDWQVEQTGEHQYHLVANQAGFQLDLSLEDVKGPVFHGENGYSQKGQDAGNSSYYFSQSHLKTVGTLGIQGKQYSVTGLSWMDHEYSTSALSTNQVGWDWFALQLDNGSELMVFQIRRSDGQVDPFSSGTVINADGTTRHLEKSDFTITVLDTWKSPTTQAIYPSHWKVEVPSLNLSLDIEPYIPDQELVLRYVYWEGAVKFSGIIAGKVVRGSGYIELTGYGGSMGGEF